MNPEEAVQAYRALGGVGGFVGMHWGTFRLTDEPPLEPPARTRDAWREAGLPFDDLHEPGIGGTVRVEARGPGNRPGVPV
jgi:L-ascorbate metabolism protein UlaG (beta-lactamase superfamily)